MTLGLGRAALVRVAVERATTRCAPTRSRRRSPRIGPPATGRSPIVATVGTTSSTSVDPVAADRRRSPSARACGCTSIRPTPGVVALLPGASRAVRRLGARRFDRRQPAQVAVHAARRVAAADAAGCRSCATAFSLVPEYLRTLDRDDAGPRLQRVHAAARPAVPGAQAVDPAALVRARGAASADRAPPRAGRRGSPRWVDDDPDWERLAPVPFSTVCFRWHPAGWSGDRRRRSTRRNAAIMDAVNRTGEVFLSHTRLDGRFTIRVAIGNLRTEPRHVERAWALLREAAAEREASPADARRRTTSSSSRRPRSCATGSTPTTRPPTSCGSATTARRPASPSVSWSEAVDEALCVGWIDSVRYSARRRPRSPSASRRAARAAPGARSTSPRSRR